MPVLNRSTTKKKPKDAPSADVTSSWYDTPVEATVADLDRVNSATKKERYRRWTIWACLIMVPLLLVAVIGLLNQNATLKSSVAGVQDSVTKLEKRPAGGASQVSNSQGRYSAQQALAAWLASQPSPLPGGKLLYWTGSSALPSSSPSIKRTQETFALTGGNGSGYLATMEVAIDPRGGSQVLNGPSLNAIAGNATDNWANTDPWIGIKADDNVTTQISGAATNWANAYFGGNAQQLGLVVGDPNAGHTYDPISGASSVATTVEHTAQIPNAGGGATTIAQVSLVPAWNDATPGQNGAGNPIVMDVLIRGANTAAPQIVAWGAPGSGPTLKPYQNALTVPASALSQPSSSASPSTTAKAPTPAKTQTPTSKPSTTKK